MIRAIYKYKDHFTSNQSVWVQTGINMKIIIALTCVLAVVLSMTANDVEWEKFKTTYGKDYINADVESIRRKIYFENKQMIAAHNELYSRGLVSYSMKLNRFSDMLPSEVAQMLNGYLQKGNSVQHAKRILQTGRQQPSL